MNKQELINRLKELLTTPSELEGYDSYDGYDRGIERAIRLGKDFYNGYDRGIERAIRLAKDLDDPVRHPEPKPLEIEKPVVPQYVADWYEEHKDNFEDGVYDLFVDFYEYEFRRNLSTDLNGWFKLDASKPIETLVKMKLFGYEVQKEKLYRAKNRHTGEYLCYCFGFYHDKNSSSENQRFTAEEKRWKELGYWNNDLYVFEEAEGEDE